MTRTLRALNILGRNLLVILFMTTWFWGKAQVPRDYTVPQNIPYCILRAPAPALQSVRSQGSCYQFFMCYAQGGTFCSSASLGYQTWGSCLVTPEGQRSGFEVDPNAHPVTAPTPFLNFESADYFMSVLSPYGGDWYGCFGTPVASSLPARTPPVSDFSNQAGYCVLRNADLYQPNNEVPPICFEFYKASSAGSVVARRASIVNGFCFVTALAAREGWEVDPNFGGPYIGDSAWMESEMAMSTLSRYFDDFYGCLRSVAESPSPDSAPGNSCPWAFDGVCDEPYPCEVGTDSADCLGVAPDPNSCVTAFDGECDEPEFCDFGTDTADCYGITRDVCLSILDGICDEPYIGTGLCPAGTDILDCQLAVRPEICNDGIDNDGDGYIDASDADCQSATEVCHDGLDNDGDGQVDEDCQAVTEICVDGLDNNANGQVDEGCTPEVEACADGIDNDLDGQIDEDCNYLRDLYVEDNQCEDDTIGVSFDGQDLGNTPLGKGRHYEVNFFGAGEHTLIIRPLSSGGTPYGCSDDTIVSYGVSLGSGLVFVSKDGTSFTGSSDSGEVPTGQDVRYLISSQ